MIVHEFSSLLAICHYFSMRTFDHMSAVRIIITTAIDISLSISGVRPTGLGGGGGLSLSLSLFYLITVKKACYQLEAGFQQGREHNYMYNYNKFNTKQ